MKLGDQVRVYPHSRPEMATAGIVIALAEHGRSIAVTLLPDERHIYAHREGQSSSWIDLETGEPLEIV